MNLPNLILLEQTGKDKGQEFWSAGVGIIVNLDVWCSHKRKTIPSVAIQKLMQSFFIWSCLKPPAGFTERDKKLYWPLDCCSERLHSLYL